MPVAVTVLYEDQRGPRRGFGLHALVKACVFDAIDGERHRVEEMLADDRPLKGVQCSTVGARPVNESGARAAPAVTAKGRAPGRKKPSR